MSVANTATHYGSVTRVFHWLTALLILGAIPLGLIANGIPLESEAQVAQKTLLFSVHKTIGVAVFFVALARIAWALTQVRPAPLHPDRVVETFVAATVHWLLYISLVAVPLSGWLHHSATTGFAPIWWPFGQSLPFVPVDFRVAEFFAAWHWLFTKVLAVAVLLHVAGALKHAVIDRDATLTRMTTGRGDIPETEKPESRSPAIIAFAIWALTIAGGTALGLSQEDASTENGPEVATTSGWVVQEGSIAVTVRQLGADVTGRFTDWIAIIEFDPDTESEIKGSADVTIDIASFDIGTVTQQALSADFLDAPSYPLAFFSGPIVEDPQGDGYVVLGTLSVKGVDVAVGLPFSFRLDGDVARVEGSVSLDRRDFGIGDTLTDDESLAFEVTVDVSVVATPSD